MELRPPLPPRASSTSFATTAPASPFIIAITVPLRADVVAPAARLVGVACSTAYSHRAACSVLCAWICGRGGGVSGRVRAAAAASGSAYACDLHLCAGEAAGSSESIRHSRKRLPRSILALHLHKQLAQQEAAS